MVQQRLGGTAEYVDQAEGGIRVVSGSCFRAYE